MAQDRLLASYGTKATSRYLNVGESGQRVHVLEVGEGEPIVMFHGGGNCAAGLEPLLHALGEKYHVLAPDLPGFGLTDGVNYRDVDLRNYFANFAESVMDGLGLSQAVVLGNSMGGWCGALFAFSHPDRVKKLIFVGGPYGIDKNPPTFARLAGNRWLNGILFSTVARPGRRSLRTTFGGLVANPDKVSAEYFDCSLANFVMPKWKTAFLTLAEQGMSLRRLNRDLIIDELRGLKTPIFFLWGEKDQWVSVSSGQELAKTLPNARFEAIPNAGHIPWLDEPERCTELLLGFLGT